MVFTKVEALVNAAPFPAGILFTGAFLFDAEEFFSFLGYLLLLPVLQIHFVVLKFLLQRRKFKGL
jgi:hypothetical protein